MKNFLIKGSIFIPIIFIISSVIVSVCYFFCPQPELKHFTPYSKAYFDDEGELLRVSLAADDRYRLYERLANISPTLIEATILYEDQYFYEHSGVDFTALLRAFWTSYIVKERRVGASTIVMQLARLRWGIKSNTIKGKLHQIARAVQLSRHYSKQEILEAYLNLTPYGRNIEGVAAASLVYFNKKPHELSFLEALSLAVIPQNPNKRNPTSIEGYQHLSTARRRLFERWLKSHPQDQIKSKYLDLRLAVRGPEQLPFKAPHFVNHLEQRLSSWDHGFIITTLNFQKQKIIEDIVREYTGSNSKKGINNASALLVNYKTLAIEAMIGSADFYNDKILGQVNGVSAKRSPGSALKPFVYALAMDEGLIHPHTLLKDAPTKFGGFTPENYDKQFLGPISVNDALIQSRNVPAVVLQSKLKRKSFYQLLVDVGITGLKGESHYGLALALGGGEVSSLELATLYAMLANGGELSSLRLLKKDVKDTNKKLLSAEASYLTLDILKNNPAPDSLSTNSQLVQHNEVAWKTGTSWAFRDAWAAGVSGPYVLIVWIGNFNGEGNSSFIGRSAAGPLLFRLFDAVSADKNWTFDAAYPLDTMNLKRLKMCANTGDLDEKYCPNTIDGWFIPGVSPIKSSHIYREILINKVTGLRACEPIKGKTVKKVYEFWPSEFLTIYRKAGISIKPPPAYEQGCDLNFTSSNGQNPFIVSPQSNIDYVTRMTEHKNTIPLIATVDAGVKVLHWFIDDNYIASVTKDEPLFWNATPGQYSSRVVDDYGRSASKVFTVLITDR